MEKLSSILPSNPRVKSVDMTDAQPRRPGAPAFGAPVGRNTVQDRVSLSQAQMPEMIKDAATYNPRDFRSSKTTDFKTKDFFNNRLKPTDAEISASAAAFESLETVREEAPAKVALVVPEEVPLQESLQ